MANEPPIGAPYIVMWELRIGTGFLGGKSVSKKFTDRAEAVKFFREAQEKFKDEPKHNFEMAPTFYRRDQDSGL